MLKGSKPSFRFENSVFFCIINLWLTNVIQEYAVMPQETACLILSSFLDSENCSATDRDNSGAIFLAPVIWRGLDNKTGSRDSDGNVPNVNWNSGNRKVYVNWYGPDSSNDDLRSRSEVSA